MTRKVNWKKITEFKESSESPGFLLWQVSTKWRRLIESALSTLELTHTQFVLLTCLGWLTQNENSVSQVQLAQYCSLDVTMTSQVLRGLEKKGSITRKQKEGNERSKFPELTTQGVKLVEKALPLVEQVDREFFETLGPKVNTCIKMMQKLAEEKGCVTG